MLDGAVRPRLEKMDSHDPDVSVSAAPDRLFRLSDLSVQIPDIGVQIADMGVQIEPIQVFRLERDAHLWLLTVAKG
jgi:hypothetical protein